MKKIFLLIITALTISTANGQSWLYLSTVPTGDPLNSICVVDQNVIWVCGDATTCYRSTNGGFNWIAAYTGLPSGNLYGISAIDANTCWVGTVTGSIYKTTNGGTNWTLQQAVAGSFMNGIKMFDSNFGVYIGDPASQTGQPYQFRRTTNGGTNWVLSPTAPISSTEFGVINAWDWLDTATFWTGSANTTPNATSAKIYRTTTGFFGTWSFATVSGTGGTNGLYYQAIAFINATSGLAGSNASAIMRTTNGGVTWSLATNPPGVTTYAAINMHGFKDASGLIRISLNETAGYKVFRTTNLGASWTQETLPSQATTNGLQHIQFLNQNLGYACGGVGMVFRYGPPLGVEPGGNIIPDKSSLKQNYPNPFNPKTTIKFLLAQTGNVTLKVYNLMGQEVVTLLTGIQTAGEHSVTFDASNLPSGTYFYSIKSGDFTDTKTMVLVK
jgi:photosystem II stability/assembly factor-like uncharacterized protein